MAGGVLTVPRLFLGEALKRLRAESGKTLDDSADAIGKKRSQLINVLDGKGTLAGEDLEALLVHLGASPAQQRELLELGVEARKRPTRRPYTDLLPGAFERMADLEALATEIWVYDRGVVPGLLQTPQYIEALMTDGDGIWWESSWQERANRIQFRLERQKLIMASDRPKSLHFVITDDALRTDVGGDDTMSRQLEHLLTVIDERPNITVQVLPATAPHNPAQLGGVYLLQFGEMLRPVGLLPVVYGPSTYFDAPSDTARLSRAFGKVEGLAMTPADSRKVIADLATRS